MPGRIKRTLARVLPVPARTSYRMNQGVLDAVNALGKEVSGINRRLDTIDKLIIDINTEMGRDICELKEETAAVINAAGGIYNKIINIEKKIWRVEGNIRLIADHKEYEYYKNLKPVEYRCALEELYEKRIGAKPNIYDPQTYNEKIQWLKLYDSTALKTTLSDKLDVRSWVKDKIGEEYLTPLLGVWEHYSEIDFNALPERFALKCTHGYAWNLIVKDKSALDHKSAESDFERWLNTNFAFVAGLELQYRDIPPRIIAEEYLENSDADLYDYKIWCFNGEPEYIQFISNRNMGLKMAFFDLDWNLLPFVYSYPQNKEPIPKPACLGEMLRLAKALCQGFSHVRVDFYVLNDGSIRFGEMTFTSASGMCKWDPPEYDLILGQKITLPALPIV